MHQVVERTHAEHQESNGRYIHQYNIKMGHGCRMAVEVEGTINSRPLIYLRLDAKETVALTPSHSILYSTSGVKQLAVNSIDKVVVARNAWVQIQFQTDVFLKRWMRAYLPTLTLYVKWLGPVSIGDIVLVVEEGMRNCLARGHLFCIFHEGIDGRIRHAEGSTSAQQRQKLSHSSFCSLLN